MSKKILAALLAVLMVVSILPMSAAAAEAPAPVVAANLTADSAAASKPGAQAPANGSADNYYAELNVVNGKNIITIHAEEMVQTIAPGQNGSNAKKGYWVGVGLKSPTNAWPNNGIWANKDNDPTPGHEHRWWPTEQTVEGTPYKTFYWGFSSPEAANDQTRYIKAWYNDPDYVKENNDPVEYEVKFDLHSPRAQYKLTVEQAEGGTITVTNPAVTGEGMVPDNELVSVKVVPTDATVKSFEKFKLVNAEGTDLVENGTVVVRLEETGEYTFNMPSGNVTLIPVYKDEVVKNKITFTDANNTTFNSVTYGNNVTVTSNDTQVPKDVTVTVVATPAEGYKLNYITVSPETGKASEVYAGNDGKFTFTMPDQNVTITSSTTAYLTLKEVKLDPETTLPDGAEVTISVPLHLHNAKPEDLEASAAGKKLAAAGETVTVSVTPPDGKKVASVTYSHGVTTNASATKGDGISDYRFTMPAEDVTVTVTFAELPQEETYIVEVSEAKDGNDSPVTTTTVTPVKERYQANEYVNVKVTPNDTYKVTGVTVKDADDGDVAATYNEAQGYWTFQMPAKNVTVTPNVAAIAETLYVITPCSGVSPDKTQAVAGATITLAVASNVTSVTVNPEGGEAFAASKTSDGTYYFTMPSANVTISATYQSTGSGSSGGSSSSGTTGSVSVTKPANGTVASNVSTAKEGDKVTVTVTPDASYYVVTGVTASGDSGTIRATKNADGTYSFTMPAGNVTVNTTIRHIYDLFTDVPSDIAEYGTAIKWAVEKNITLGTDPANYSTFGPYSPCTRAQMVVFLYRAAGSPAVTGTNSFTDLPSDSEIQKAVQWAVSKDITKGTSAATFDPYAPCTRGQMVTFLHRNHSEPAAAGSNSFADVSADAFYKTAVQWAVNSGVTKGTSDTTFDPDSACTRVQMVTFLYRDMGK